MLRIREKYAPREETLIEQVRRLDRGVTQKGSVPALILGILGTLLLGVGMCCTMLWAENWFIPGIAIGVIGIVGVSLAYPIYVRVTKKERAKIAPEILRLTDELMK
ncbi:MAG: hypothetical protein IJ042_07590 [Butyricicoccus sp.]|nr:hypothetical protein [Butyricicoccus sp.]